jgi:hypothetical protein
VPRRAEPVRLRREGLYSERAARERAGEQLDLIAFRVRARVRVRVGVRVRVRVMVRVQASSSAIMARFAPLCAAAGAP